MEKINKCPMCGIHQRIKYSDDLVLGIEDIFDTLHAAAAEHDTLKAKAELFDEAAVLIHLLFMSDQVTAYLHNEQRPLFKMLKDLAPKVNKLKE
jgi:hypothetical protein